MSLNITRRWQPWPQLRRSKPTHGQHSEASIGTTLRKSETPEFEAALAALSPEHREHRLLLRRQAENIARGLAHVEAEREADRQWLKS